MRIAAQLGLAPSKPTAWGNINLWRAATGVFGVAAAAAVAIVLITPTPTTTPTVAPPAVEDAS